MDPADVASPHPPSEGVAPASRGASRANADGRFILSPADPRRARLLGEQLGLRFLTGQLLLNRGIRNEQEARRFLDPRLSDLRPPEGAFPMAGFSKAADRLRQAVLDRETIGVFGDYDVDGV